MTAGKLPKSAEVPKILGGLEEEYEILSELGRGGTAVVYLARDRALDRQVAVKVIRSTYVEDEEAVARLVREARTVGQLQHPNIVMLYGTRRLDDNSLALIMQYVPGRPLKAVIRNDGPLPFKMVTAVLDDIASALSYAHRQKIVHRDIKPENIYLDEAVEVARLADFGIARHWDKDAGITLPGMAIGTPTYMSPEQIDGAQLDGRSDIYSLGIVGYEMLTGQQPWAGENLYSIIYKQKREQLPRLDRVRPGMPEELQATVEGALKKRPEDRWQSAEQFLACLRGQEVEEVTSRHGPRTGVGPGRDGAVVDGEPDEATDGEGPTIDDQAMTIRYRRPTDQELSTAAEDEAPDGASPTFELDDDARREDREILPWPDPVHEQKRGLSRRRVVLLGVLAFVSAGLAFMAFQSVAPTNGGAEVPPLATNGSTVDPSGGAEGPEGGSALPTAGLPDRLEVLGAGSPTGEAGAEAADPLRVRVLDQDGVPVKAAMVEFTVTSGGGRVRPRIGTADDEGVVEAAWVLGTEPEVDEVAVRVPGFGDDGPSLTIQARRTEGGQIVQTPDPAGTDVPPGGGTRPSIALVSVVSGGSQSGAPGEPLEGPVRVQVLDGDGDPVAGATVLFEPEEGHGTAENPTARTDARGFAESAWELGPGEGIQRLRVSVEGQGLGAVAEARAATPVVAALRPRSTVVAGATHACATSSSGTVTCWGGNTFGQLGDGGRTRISRPAAVAGNLSFARVAAGFSATCGITTTGEAYCWGRNEVGELGDGTTSQRLTPNPVSGNRRFVDIWVGWTHACALTSSGQAFCWGENDSGQLGDGSTVDRSQPTPVGGGLRFRRLTTGWNHTCGETGSVTYCWGSNEWGQLGSGTGANERLPTRVDVPFSFAQMDAGGTHTCGVSSAGLAYCWGRNQYGQLGDGTDATQATPVPVTTETTFSSIATGTVHSCGLTSTGRALCWGRNNWGQLGDGTTVDRNVPAPVEGSLTFTSLSVKGNHTCGQASEGALYCWGYNSDGQLGDGSRQNRSVPTRVGG